MDNSKNFFKSTVGIVVSLAVLGVTVWVISRAWKTGQK
jgi:predicted negative regulator of RcsB-dependent stress response